MKVASCRRSVVPPKIPITPRLNQLMTLIGRPLALYQTICTTEATIATAVATKIPCHWNAAKKRSSGKKSTSKAITLHYTRLSRSVANPALEETGVPAQSRPVEARPGIGLAPRCDVAVAREVGDRIGPAQGAHP